MRLIFLGTSAGAPTRERNVSALAVQLDSGDVWLVDCGEGTQHQIMRSPVKPGRIRRVLLTHLHGDHCFGLPGLLASIGLHGGTSDVEVIGPVGVGRFLQTTLEISASTLPFALRVSELLPRMHRLAADTHGTSLLACPITHRVPCFGYVIAAPDRRGRLDVSRAHALGVHAGPDLGRLSDGEDVVLADGRRVTAASVLGPPRPGARVVVLGDTSDPSAIADAAKGCDVLVHEATYADDLRDKALTYGHSTAAMAGAFAARVGARTLVLTHFSARYATTGASPSVEDLRQEASSTAPSTTVLAASDLFSLDL